MWLTKNEKKVLKLLLSNSKITDTTIAKQLNISSQAIGNIRKNLEYEKVIESYNIKLNSKKLGVNTFAMIRLSIPEKSDKREVEQKIVKLKNTISFIQTMEGNRNYLVFVGFSDLEEMEDFVNGQNDINTETIIKEVIFYCQKNILKCSIKDLLESMIDKSGTKKVNIKFP